MKKIHLSNRPIFLILLVLSLFIYGFSSLPQGSNQEGWYLVSEEAIIPDHDYSIAGKNESYLPEYPGYKNRYYKIYQGSVSSGSFNLNVRYEEPDGRLMVCTVDRVTPLKADMTASWSRPPNYIAAGEQVSLQVTQSIAEDSSLNVGPVGIRFTPRNYFVTAAGENIRRENFSGTVTMQSGAPRGRSGAEEVISVSLGTNYHYRYVYEWREGPPDDVAAVVPLSGPDERDQEGGGGGRWLGPFIIIGGLGVIAIIGVIGGAVLIGIKVLGGGAAAAGSGITRPGASRTTSSLESPLGQKLPADFIQDSQFGSPSDNPNLDYQSQRDQCRPY